MSALANTKSDEFKRLLIDDTEEQVDRDPEKVISDERRVELVDEGNIVEEVQRERGENQSKGRGRKAITGLVFLFVIAACAVGSWYVIGNGAKRKAKVPVSSHASAESDDAKTKQAIEEANSSGPGITLSDGSVVRPGMPSPSPTPSAPDGNVPVTELRPNNGDLSDTVNSANRRAAEETSAVEQESVKASSVGRNTERSIRIGEDLKAPAKEVDVGAAEVRTEEGRDDSGVTVPPFGSMLPVRSLGILYTLRSGGLARFELTRDVRGNGWTMRRGTVLIGALRGAEFDRAYVSLVGFLDGESGRFVKISGDLLGSDGGSGIQGKRRKLSGGWSRVLSKLGEAGLSVAGAFAGSIGRRSVVINDAFGSSAGRVSSELDGVLLGHDRNSFVEVAAGSSGYMMITELPDSVKGVDALSRLSGEDMEERTDVEQPRRRTGISERELAELIQSGDREQIRDAMPRMTPQMRRIAEAVISGEFVAR